MPPKNSAETDLERAINALDKIIREHETITKIDELPEFVNLKHCFANAVKANGRYEYHLDCQRLRFFERVGEYFQDEGPVCYGIQKARALNLEETIQLLLERQVAVRKEHYSKTAIIS